VITIRTTDFVGILADVIPLASTDTEMPSINAVRVEWDGQQLHALATDRIRMGISSWDPDDAPEVDAQDDMFTDFGGADDPWAVNVALDDARHLVKTYKLPVKQGNTPITVEIVVGDMKVIRSRETGHSAITVKVDGQSEPFPDLRELLSMKDALVPVMGLAFGARLLADFGKVRPRGPLELEFTGAASLAHVRIGERFVGAIMPTRLGDARESVDQPITA
jgi:hypothetical protein